MLKEVLQNELLDNESRLTCWRGQRSLFTRSALSWIAKFPSRTSEVIEPQRHLWGATESFPVHFNTWSGGDFLWYVVCSYDIDVGRLYGRHTLLFTPRKKSAVGEPLYRAQLSCKLGASRSSIGVVGVVLTKITTRGIGRERSVWFVTSFADMKHSRIHAQRVRLLFFLEVDWFRFLVDVCVHFLGVCPNYLFHPPPYLVV